METVASRGCVCQLRFQIRDFSRRFGKIATFGHLWVDSGVCGTKDHLQSHGETKPRKREVQGPGLRPWKLRKGDRLHPKGSGEAQWGAKKGDI